MDLICPKCSRNYQDPRLLPCGDSLCHECILNLVEASQQPQFSQINCPICRETHIIPKNSQFPKNNFINKLLLNTTSSHSHSPTMPQNSPTLSELLKQSLKQLSEKRQQLEPSFEVTANSILGHCDQIRSQIDMANDAQIGKLNKHRNDLLNELKQYETETIRSLENKKVDEGMASFLAGIDDFNWQTNTYLNAPASNINEQHLNDRIKIANNLLKAADVKIDVNRKKMPLFEINSTPEANMGNCIGKLCFGKNMNVPQNNDLMKSIDLKSVYTKIGPNFDVHFFGKADMFFLFNYVSVRESPKAVVFDRLGKVVSSTYQPNLRLIKATTNHQDLVYFLFQKENINDLLLELWRFERNASWTKLVSQPINIPFEKCHSMAVNSHGLFLLTNDYLIIFPADLKSLPTKVAVNFPMFPFYLPGITNKSKISVDEEYLYFYSDQLAQLHVKSLSNGAQVSMLILDEMESFAVYRNNKSIFCLKGDEITKYSIFGEQLGPPRKISLLLQNANNHVPVGSFRPENLKIVQCVDGKVLILDKFNFKVFFD